MRAPGRTEVLWHPVAALERSAGLPRGRLAPLAATDALIRAAVQGAGDRRHDALPPSDRTPR